MTLLLADLQNAAVGNRTIPKAGATPWPRAKFADDNLFVEEFDRIGEEGKGFVPTGRPESRTDSRCLGSIGHRPGGVEEGDQLRL